MRAVFKKAYIYLFLLYAPGFLALVMYAGTQNIKFKDYIKYRYPIKEISIDWNARIQMFLLGHTNNGSVHFGKDSWLFYITQGDGSSYNDYWGIGAPLLEKRWREYLIPTTEHPYGFSAKYLLIIPPNKESVYPEKTRFLFTDFINKNLGNYNRILKLVNAEFPHIFVDVKGKLIEEKEKYPTYYSADTHWNQWGAYVAHLELLKKAGEVLKTPIEVLSLESIKRIDAEQKDIHDMINHNSFLLRQVNLIEPDVHIEIKSECAGKPRVDEKEYTVYSCPGKKFVVWFIGDSFSDRMKPLLSHYFKTTIFLRYSQLEVNPYIARAYKEGGAPDLIIDEKVERFLPRVSKYRNYVNDLEIQ